MKLPELTIGDIAVELPIIQGGMSVRTSGPYLAAAVAECGAIGTIGGTGIPTDELQAAITKAKELTEGIVAVNIMFAMRDFMEQVMAAIEAKVDMIITGAGFSRDIFAVGKEHGVPIVSIVSSAGLARMAEKKGADAIVVEAKEAGGHLGTDEPLRELFPKVREVISRIPLIAAGGITDGADIAEMMDEYGADGVQMATRFVLTDECEASPAFKQAYLDAEKDDVVIMHSPVGLPGRAIRNPLVRRIETGEQLDAGKCKRSCLKSCDKQYCILDRLERSFEGDADEGLVFCGENVWKLHDILPVRQVIERLVNQAEALYHEVRLPRS